MTSASPVPAPRSAWPGVQLGMLAVLVGAAAGSLLVLFRAAIDNMAANWNAPEYNHGPLIPVVAFYLFWLRARELAGVPTAASWAGLGAVLAAVGLLMLGDLSSVFAISQYALVVAVAALALAAVGWRGIAILWVPLVYLAFMVPVPDFIENRLTAGLQLISSQIGVAVIRLAGISVYLEGNVIDLGTYKLQVAEACSGMRYLFPLLSFGFLCAALFRGRPWQRAVLVASTIPITILMNSFRIGVIGILVNYFGIEQAEGFLHDFEGWIVFMACVAILFLEVMLFARLNGDRFLSAFGLDIPPVADLTALAAGFRLAAPAVAAVAAIVVAAGVSVLVERPAPVIPERGRLATFPLAIETWRGREEYVEQIYLNQLKTSDYLMATYARPVDRAGVELWIAYYDEQVSGASVHSPKACLPGGGWEIESLEERVIPAVGPQGESRRVNRAVIRLGEVRQIVYYWFDQRGRKLTNELAVKWFIFVDGLTQRRTDGALVRLSTLVAGDEGLQVADDRLADFVRAIDPRLAYHIPDAKALPRQLATAP